jgi:hypothetical protein
MPDPRHSKQTTADGIHTAVAYSYASAALRTGATGFLAADVGKLAYQTDNDSVWILKDTTPTWIPVNEAAFGVPDDTLVFGAGSVGTTTTSRYLVFGYTPNIAPIMREAIRASRAGTCSNLRVRHNTVGVGGNISYTLYRNGVASALTAAVAASALAGSDLVDQVIVAADDLLELRATKGSSIGSSPAEITVTVEFNS